MAKSLRFFANNQKRFCRVGQADGVAGFKRLISAAIGRLLATLVKGDSQTVLELRLLGDSDVSLVETWLNKEHVKRWYEIPSLGIAIDDWMSEIKGRHEEFCWLTHLIALWEGRPIGLCQSYKCVDSDEDWGALPLTGAYGIDYLIGEESLLGKGLGKGIITLLVNRIFSLSDAQRVVADIDKDNKASEKALLASGFALFDAGRNRYAIQREQTGKH